MKTFEQVEQSGIDRPVSSQVIRIDPLNGLRYWKSKKEITNAMNKILGLTWSYFIEVEVNFYDEKLQRQISAVNENTSVLRIAVIMKVRVDPLERAQNNSVEWCIKNKKILQSERERVVDGDYIIELYKSEYYNKHKVYLKQEKGESMEVYKERLMQKMAETIEEDKQLEILNRMEADEWIKAKLVEMKKEGSQIDYEILFRQWERERRKRKKQAIVENKIKIILKQLELEAFTGAAMSLGNALGLSLYK